MSLWYVHINISTVQCSVRTQFNDTKFSMFKFSSGRFVGCVGPVTACWGALPRRARAYTKFSLCPSTKFITDPRIRSTKKKLGRVKQTILFRVVVKTDLPKILPPEDPVYRRYTQFRWLHARLGEKYPGVARPPFPAKLKVGGLEPRRSGLERYMRRLVTEPSFLLSTELQIFLTANDVEMAQVMSLPVLPFLLRGKFTSPLFKAISILM